MEANEVISLSMDNIWRSTQLFYISAPLLLYSIIKGVQEARLPSSGFVSAACFLRPRPKRVPPRTWHAGNGAGFLGFMNFSFSFEGMDFARASRYQTGLWFACHGIFGGAMGGGLSLDKPRITQG